LNAYDLLSEPIRRFVRSQQWGELRPIQVAAIQNILTTQNNYILAARTASGKTEAAFLPILSSIDPQASGIQVLYISPLIALINDQFFRIEELVRYLDIKITKWHGDSSRSKKQELLRNPSGVLFITPESIESLFINHPFEIGRLLGNVKFIIVDEIHSFLGTRRGVQLQSLLSRIKALASSIRFVGLSATIGSYEEAKQFFGEYETTKILLDKTPQRVDWQIEYFQQETSELPINLIEALYTTIQNRRTLIFPNSRGKVEEIAVRLKALAKAQQTDLSVFSHHSSVDKEVRQFAEHFAKTERNSFFCIVCTSTLELGIDIGAVDLIVQLDSTASVSSLAQRLGRSGRTEGAKSSLNIVVTDAWHVLQSLACITLMESGHLEPTRHLNAPIDVLFQQILSILKQSSGMTRQELIGQIEPNHAFSNLPKGTIEQLLDYMIGEGYVQDLKREIIVGLRAERLVNGRDIYSVFDREDNMSVIFKGHILGELFPSPDLEVGQSVYLAASIWTVVEMDKERKKLWVERAAKGRRPTFVGQAVPVDTLVRSKMLELVSAGYSGGKLDTEASAALKQLHSRFASAKLETDRPVLLQGEFTQFFTFASTRVNRTLQFLLQKGLGINCALDDHSSSLEFKTGMIAPQDLLPKIVAVLTNLESLVTVQIEADSYSFPYPRWAEFLDTDSKLKIVIDEFFDVESTKAFCETVRVKIVGFDL
jgi:ATP-dependent Lhr-like helicase